MQFFVNSLNFLRNHEKLIKLRWQSFGVYTHDLLRSKLKPVNLSDYSMDNPLEETMKTLL